MNTNTHTRTYTHKLGAHELGQVEEREGGEKKTAY